MGTFHKLLDKASGKRLVSEDIFDRPRRHRGLRVTMAAPVGRVRGESGVYVFHDVVPGWTLFCGLIHGEDKSAKPTGGT